MAENILRWLKKTYKNTITSIAFLPAVIAILFLVLSFLMVQFDFSSTGKSIKLNLHWLSLKDASTARSICSAIAGGIISLAVFSFSMVMILLNQAAANMSNRILGTLIGNRFQQFVLGFYIGTIVYALFLLSTIRDVDSGINIPAISTYLLIALTVVDIFLFIYFLHYITQSVKYETIIHKVYDNTKEVMLKNCFLTQKEKGLPIPSDGIEIGMHKSGLFQGINQSGLLSFCEKEDIVVYFLHPVGSFLINGVPLLKIVSKKKQEYFKERLNGFIHIERGQDINANYYYGFTQLMEIAVKALSPGINDPGTAVISLQAIADLLAYRLHHFPETQLKDGERIIRIFIKDKTFKELFDTYVMPIWDYGKKDRLVQQQMQNILTQLKIKGNEPVVDILLIAVNEAIAENKNRYSTTFNQQ